MPEADRQYVSLYNGSSESPQLRQGRNKQRRKSLQSDPVTDERLHRIEKTLREMQLKLDEVNREILKFKSVCTVLNVSFKSLRSQPRSSRKV